MDSEMNIVHYEQSMTTMRLPKWVAYRTGTDGKRLPVTGSGSTRLAALEALKRNEAHLEDSCSKR